MSMGLHDCSLRVGYFLAGQRAFRFRPALPNVRTAAALRDAARRELRAQPAREHHLACHRVLAAYTPDQARARLSALHRSAESAGSRSRPRPTPPPQGATALANKFVPWRQPDDWAINLPIASTALFRPDPDWREL
jgi:hypothetical protein